jgi:hypothetical protein
MKTFKGDFYKFYEMLRNKIPFSFCKFSDGELFILQNKELILGPRPEHHSYTDDQDHKTFIPGIHEFYRQKLFNSLSYCANNYYAGICVPSDQGNEIFNWMKEISKKDDDHLSWANLFVNSNYGLYRDLFIKEYSNYEIVIVCNQKSDIKKLPFKIKKDFRVGTNCIINDYPLVEQMKTWVKDNNIKNHLFLFCCSSLGNFLCHQLHEIEPNNTYFDCGSTLNPLLGLSLDRGYLSAYEGVLWRGQDTKNDLERDEPWGS